MHVFSDQVAVDLLTLSVRVLAVALCLSLTVTSRCSVETVNELVFFGMGASFHLSYIVL